MVADRALNVALEAKLSHQLRGSKPRHILINIFFSGKLPFTASYFGKQKKNNNKGIEGKMTSGLWNMCLMTALRLWTRAG